MKLENLDNSIPQIMGVLNVTPDSFSDGGALIGHRGVDLSLVAKRAQAMLEAGASILDVGGESTRPGAELVSTQEEMDRVLPVLEMLHGEFDCVLSLDSSTPELMGASLGYGVDLLNDVRAFSKEGALEVACNSGVNLCFMHMQGMPKSMQDNPSYENVVNEVANYLRSRMEQAVQCGVDPAKIWIDPGFGFGKTLRHNLLLLEGLPELAKVAPLLIGVSRKRMIGEMTGREVTDRAVGSALVGFRAMQLGAKIVRVHDVAETLDAVNIYKSLAGLEK